MFTLLNCVTAATATCLRFDRRVVAPPFWSRLVALWIVLGLSLTARADDLGDRVVWDASQFDAAQWQTANGITAAVACGALVLRTGAVESGWAATPVFLPLTDSTTLDLEVRTAVHGQLVVQVEWLDADGRLAGATNVLQRSTALKSRKLADYLAPGAFPRTFRLKFWIEGKNAEIQIARATVTAKRAWRKPATRLVKVYDARSGAVSGPGMTVRAMGSVIEAAGVPASAFLFEEPVSFDPKAVVILDVSSVRNGGISLQVLCWDATGNQLEPVTLFEDVTVTGLFEAPLAARREQFSPATSKLTFKVWLDGQKTDARIAGLFYGIAP